MPVKNNKQNRKKPEFTIKYVIPDNLQDCYVNGAYGGITPRNEISMHMFCERLPIPKTMSHTINRNGTLSKEKIETKGGNIVRLIQSSVMMDVSTATAIRDWLDEKIKFVEEKEKTVKAVKKVKRGK